MKHPSRTRTAALLLCCCCTVGTIAQGVDAYEPRRRRKTRRRRHLAQATIKGTVYHDVNQNGQYDPMSEEPLEGVVVGLFTCSNGSRAGVTLTNGVGKFSFDIPGDKLSTTSSGEQRGCFYIQYNAPTDADGDFPISNPIFSTPKNGETTDINVSLGDQVNMYAGIYEQESSSIPTWEWTTNVNSAWPTPSSSWSWNTFTPTAGGGVATPAPITPAPITPSPVTAAPVTVAPVTAAPVSKAPTLKPSVAPTKVTSPPTRATVATTNPPTQATVTTTIPPPTDPDFIVPLPIEIVAVIDDVVTNTTTNATDQNEGAENPCSFCYDAILDKSVVISEEEDGMTTTCGMLSFHAFNVEETSEICSEIKGAEALCCPGEGEESPSANITGSVPSTNATASIIPPTNFTATEGLPPTEDMLSLKSTVGVQLEILESEMDEASEALFEKVCAEFLNDQLQLATPPIYNLECTVIGQSVAVEGARRHARVLRALADSSLTVDVEVTGEVEKSPSVQEADDVPFDELLVGTFNVQGDLFVDALQEAEKEEGLTTYFKSVEEVRGIAMYDDVEAPEGASESGGDEASDTGITTGVIVAIAMGGVILILLVAMFVVKARRKRGNAAAAAGSGAKGSSAAKGRSAGTASTRRSSIRRSISRSFSRNVSAGWAKPRPPPESITCTASPTNSGEAEYAVEVPS